MNWIKENWFKFSLIIGLFFIGGVLYQALIIVPINKQNEIRTNKQLSIIEEQKQKQQKIDSLNQCFSEAELKKSDSIKYWSDVNDKTCVESKLGTGTLMNRCLDAMIVEMNKAKTQEEKDRAECLRIYPQN